MIWAPGEAEQAARDFDLRRLPQRFYLDPYPVYRALCETEPVKRRRLTGSVSHSAR